MIFIKIKYLIKLCAALLLVLFSFGHKVYADYPDDKPITIIIPFAPGGSADLLAKQLVNGLESRLNTKVEVTNIRGMTGSVGLMQVKDAAPDGLWLGIATSSALIGNSVVSGNRNYHPLDDFTHIAVIATVPHILMANKNLNINRFEQFTELIKNPTAKYMFTSSGYGSSGHLLFEKLQKILGAKLEHKISVGGSGTLKALSAEDGKAHFLIDQLPATISYIKSDQVTPLAIAVTADRRVSSLPDTPTFNELGLTEVNKMSMYTLIAPKGISANIVNQLRNALTQVLQEPEVIEFFKTNGMIAGTIKEQEVINQIQAEYDFYLKVAQENNLIKITSK